MPSGSTVARARRPTRTKATRKAQPTSIDAAPSVTNPQASSSKTIGEAKAATLKNVGTHVQVTRPTVASSSVSDKAQQSAKAQIAIAAQESPEIVQTFLFSAVSTILWMRDLLPDEYFRTVFYASINKHCSYHDFTHGNDDDVGVQGNRSRPKGYHLRVLKRNVSIRGNRIVEWLESGIFDSIQRGFLGQLQVTIFADSERPTEILELYCFHFHYSCPLNDGNLVVDMEVEDIQSKKTISLKDAREALNTVVKNMVALNGTMPHLPERCFMSPYLVWNDQRPSGYQPPGFHASNDVNVSFPVTEGWAMETATCGQVKTGAHTVNLGIAYTKEVASEDNDEASLMPMNFTYGGAISRLEAFDTLSGMRNHSSSSIQDSIQAPTPRADSPVRNYTDLPMHTLEQRGGSIVTEDDEAGEKSRDDTMASAGTQSDLAHMKAMLPIETQQKYDTQRVFRPSPSLQPDCSAVATQEQSENRGLMAPPPPKTPQGRRSSRSTIISCECGVKETDNIIQCFTCDSWQHAQCYAFEGPDDSRKPMVHNCYTCLLGDATGERLHEVQQLARTRQVIHNIRVKGLNSPAQIARALGYKRALVMEILEKLQQNNTILIRHPRGASENVTLITSEESERALTKIYLDPTKDVDQIVADAAAERTLHITPGRKRKDHSPPDDEHQPKTPRLSRPRPNLEFDNNVPFTPDSVRLAEQTRG